MKRYFVALILIVTFNIAPVFTQIDEILKKVPGIEDVFEEAVSTSIKDAYRGSLWLQDLDKQLSYSSGVQFSHNLGPGLYRYRFNTFCLHAGTYAPTEGDGYLVAPLKGAKANLIRKILIRYGDHPGIDQQDVQLLLWGIEAGQKFSSYSPDFQARILPLLKADEIALMEVDVSEVGYDLLPDEVKQVLNLYRDIRYKLSDANAVYEDVERLAVRTGNAPLGKGSKNIALGTWSSIGGGVYIRCFPESYKKTNVDIFIPDEVSFSTENGGNISSMSSSNYKIDFGYEPGQNNISTASVTNLTTGEKEDLSLNVSPGESNKNETDEFINLFKKSIGKKKSSKVDSQSWKLLGKLKSIEQALSKTAANTEGYNLSLNALYSFASALESGKKKGRFSTKHTGLDGINGLVFAPANTSQQRLGNGGPEGGNGTSENNENNENKEKEKEKKCNVDVNIRQVEDKLPEPDWVYSAVVDISIEGDDEECTAEEIVFTLFDVGQERGRCINDKDKMEDSGYDLVINPGYTNPDMEVLSELSAKKNLSGKSQSVQLNVTCNDYGAYGKLKASVKVKGKWYEAAADGTPDKYITIPLDLNDNRIADSWEKENNVYGIGGDWDNDELPSGQKVNGDGMTNYEEYRGVFVDGADGPLYKRLNPHQKEIFVIDNDMLFVSTSWESASGIKAYYVTENQVLSDKAGTDEIMFHKVNFCSGYSKAKYGDKHAIRIRKVEKLHDPNNKYTDEELPLGYTYEHVGRPKEVKYIYIFVDRIKMWFEDLLVKKLDSLIQYFPNGATVDGKFYSIDILKYFRDAVNDPIKLQQLVEQETNTVVIHEMGHNCGIPHHKGGDRKCPMNYKARFEEALDNRMFEILSLIDTGEQNIIAIYQYLKFCKTGDKCFQNLNVNDK